MLLKRNLGHNQIFSVLLHVNVNQGDNNIFFMILSPHTKL